MFDIDALMGVLKGVEMELFVVVVHQPCHV